MVDSSRRSFSGTFSRWVAGDRSDLISTPVSGEADLSVFTDGQGTDWTGYKGSTTDGRLVFTNDWGQPGELMELTTNNFNGHSEQYLGPHGLSPKNIVNDNLPFSIDVDVAADGVSAFGKISLSFAAA